MNTNILDYGAKPDGVTLNTEYIQKAIDSCHQSGGGRVTVPQGKFLTGSIWLKSNVELYLEHGSVLKASSNLAHYNNTEDYPQNTDCPGEYWCGKHLVLCVEQDNVAISGTGRIEGCAESVHSGEKKHFNNLWYDMGYYETAEGAPLRPGQMVVFVECTNIKVTDITLAQSSCWTVFFHGCDWVQVRGIKIFNNPQHANSDGIDIDTCTHVTVSDCILHTGDDSITIRADHTRLVNKEKTESKFITISNCVLSSKCCAIRLGVGTGHIHHVAISNIVVEQSAIALDFLSAFCGRGSTDISDITINNVVAKKTAWPINLYASNAKFERIYISNVHSECKACIKAESAGGIIEDLKLCNIDIFNIEPNFPRPDLPKGDTGKSMMDIDGVNRLTCKDITFHLMDNYFSEKEKVCIIENSNEIDDSIKYIYKNKTAKINF